MSRLNTQHTLQTPVQAGFAWTKEKAQKFNDEGKLMYVGGGKLGRRTLSGALKSWKKPGEENVIYIVDPEFRITGTPDNIRTALKGAGVDSRTIENAINSAITIENYRDENTMQFSDEWANEIASVDAIKQRCGSTKACKYNFADLTALARLYKENGFEPATTAGTGNKNKTTVSVRGNNLSLQERANRAQQDNKVLDVSDLDAKGKGAKTIQPALSYIPGTTPAILTTRDGRLSYPGIPILSNNFDTYMQALETIYTPQELEVPAIVEGIEAMRRSFASGRLAQKTPTKRTTKVAQGSPKGRGSPKTIKAPGKKMANAPILKQASSRSPTKQATRTIGGGGLANLPRARRQ